MSVSNPGPAPASDPVVNPQKDRVGFDRLWHATGYSMHGLREGWREPAFRLEALAAILMVPVALWLGQGWVERTLLVGTVLLVMIVELLNTGIEAAIDRIGPEWHSLSKRAKDMGSAAVFLSLVLCAIAWGGAVWQRLS